MRRCECCGQPLIEEIQYPLGLNVDAYLEFHAHRSGEAKLRKGWSRLAQQKVADKLAQWPTHVQQAAVDRSIESGWTGVFPESEKVQVAPSAPGPRTAADEQLLEHRRATRPSRDEGLRRIRDVSAMLGRQ